MAKHKKESLVAAVVCAIALPSLWIGLVLLAVFLSRFRFSIPEILKKLIQFPIKAIESIAYFNEMPHGLEYVLCLVAVILFSLACIGFCTGFIFVWLIRYIENKEQECNE